MVSRTEKAEGAVVKAKRSVPAPMPSRAVIPPLPDGDAHTGSVSPPVAGKKHPLAARASIPAHET